VFYISGGFLAFQPNVVKVLADTVQRAADLDEAQAQAALKAAEAALHEKSADFDKELRPHVWPRLQLSCAPSSRSARSLAVNPSATCCVIDKKG